ncbi:TlpA family protein disulfide reductase [bacterium]|nr:TlpA family protein disulfide reductase [bacterium]
MRSKRGFVSILALLLISQVYAQKEIVLSGKIEHPFTDSVYLRESNFTNKVLYRMPLKDDSFSVKLKVEEGYYQLYDGREYTKMYLMPGKDLNITLNTEKFDESIEYSGPGAKENNYLVDFYLHNESMRSILYYGNYAKLGEEDFLELMDSCYQEKFEFLAKQEGLNEDFVAMERDEILLEYRTRILNYPGMHRFVSGNKTYKESASFPDPFKDIDFNDSRYLDLPSFSTLLDGYIYRNTEPRLKDSEHDLYLERLYVMEELIENKEVRQIALEFGWESFFPSAKERDKTYEKYMELSINEEFNQKLTTKYKALKRIEPGAESPEFSFVDINGDTVRLEDFKGSYVYIDVWATWCLPCIKEIPDLKAMEEHFHDANLQFVSVAYRDKHERWKNMVIEEELGGAQLYAYIYYDPFFKAYQISGIPHFILIDPEGYIIDPDAKRPSNRAFWDELEAIVDLGSE